MPKGRAAIAVGAVIGSATLVVTGVAYALNPDSTGTPPAAPVGWWLATLAFMGAIALAATGLWQWRSAGGMRILFLTLIAGLSAIWTAANALAILAFRQGPPDISRAYHWAGLAVSASLFLASMAEATLAILYRTIPAPAGQEAS